MYTRNRENLETKTSPLVMMGLFISLEIVLSRFVSISAWNIKIGFAFIPLVIAAIKLGPIKAGIVGALADFLHKMHTSFSRILIAVAIKQFIFSLILNTLWISILYGTPYKALFITRIIQCIIIAPVEVITINLITRTATTRIAKVNNR